MSITGGIKIAFKNNCHKNSHGIEPRFPWPEAISFYHEILIIFV
jgi:hypothetical protein